MEAKELRPGELLGRYQLLLPIAKGGMGQVWAARLTGTRGFQKLVAIKTILSDDEDSGNLEAMLFEEASLASQVRHPNVAQIYEVGEDAGTSFITMEFVEGSLRAVAGSFTRTSILDLTWSLTMRDISICYTVSVCGNMPRNSMVFDTLRLLYE